MKKIDFKSACKNISLSLKESGIELSHGKLLDLVAKSHGFKDYNTYVGLLSDYTKTKSFKEYVLVIDHEGNKDIGKQIFEMIMWAANDYYSKANITHGSRLASFSVPTVEYQQNRLILTWSSGPDGFGQNTGITFILAGYARVMNKKYSNLYSKMKNIRSIETRVENSDLNQLLENKELLYGKL